MHLPFNPIQFSFSCLNSSSLKLVKPKDPEVVLETVTDKQYDKDKFLPYWAEIWPSSEILLQYLVENDFKTAKVLEMGCGIGHISTLLSKRSLYCVASDISPEACLYAASNIRNNEGSGTALCCDWRTPPFKRNSFDLIVASDVLYEKRWIEIVLFFLSYNIAIDGVALIADPCRSHWKLFKDAAQQNGFTWEVVKTAEVNNHKSKVEILKLTFN